MGKGKAVAAGAVSPQSSARVTGAEAWKAHVTLVVGLTLCALAFWFELGRAERGNGLSWAYVFEWPLLGAFAIYMWWKLLHPGASAKRRRAPKELAPEYQGMLQAWQNEQRIREALERDDEGKANVDDHPRDPRRDTRS